MPKSEGDAGSGSGLSEYNRPDSLRVFNGLLSFLQSNGLRALCRAALKKEIPGTFKAQQVGCRLVGPAHCKQGGWGGRETEVAMSHGALFLRKTWEWMVGLSSGGRWSFVLTGFSE